MSKYYLIIVLVFCVYIKANAQNSIENTLITGTYNEVPLFDFLSTIQKEHSISVYCQESWIDSIRVTRTFCKHPLKLVLSELLAGAHLSYSIFQHDEIVIYPEIAAEHEFVSFDKKEELIIGDPLNEGRYKTALLKGQIVDGATGDNLVGAVVYSTKTKKGVSSNANGEFEIELPTGFQNLQITFIGFEPYVKKFKLIESGRLDFDLFEETHTIDEIEVVADNMKVGRTQMSLVKVNSKLIKELPVLMGEADLIKSIVLMPGVQSVGELSSGFNVRGGNADQNLVLLDGAPIYNTSHLFGFFSMINPDAISNVTLYKGGLPASYGDRVASVMDVQLKEGSNEGLQFYGGVGAINSRFTLEGPFTKNKKNTFLIGGRSTYSDWILRKVKNLNFRESVANFYDINGNVNLHLSNKNNLKLMAYSSADEFNLNSNTLYQYQNIIGALNWKLGFGENFVSNLNATYSKYSFSLDEKDKYLSELDYQLKTGIEQAGLKYSVSYLKGENMRLNGGFQLSLYHVAPGKIVPLQEITSVNNEKVADEHAIEMAGFVESEFDINDNISLSLGLRYSRFSSLGKARVNIYDENFTLSTDHIIDLQEFSKNEIIKTHQGFEPRVSFKYLVLSGGSLRWNYQRIHQYINQISNTSVVSPADFWQISNYHLKPLIGDQFALGYFRDFRQKGLETSVEVYYKNLKNLIEYKNGAQLVMNQNVETDLIQASAYAYGLELFLKKATGRFNGWVSYTFSRTMRKTDNQFDSEIINKGKYYPSVYDKPHDLSVIANYQISRRWRLSGNFVLSSGRPTTLPEEKYNVNNRQVIYYSDRNKYRMPAYHRFDLSLTIDENLKRKRSWKGSWTLSVYNLYGRKNPYSVYYQRDTTNGQKRNSYGLFQFSIIGIPVPSLTYNFRF